jgi:hypothetical protein
LTRCEALLQTQAEVLNGLFNDLTQRGYDSLSQHSGEAERIFRLAFRAQAQARATLETLAQMLNPAPGLLFAKQANIATNGGQQQVNNVARAHPQEIRDSGRGELLELEQTHGERLDTSTTGSAGRGDPPLETVGAIVRPANGQG